MTYYQKVLLGVMLALELSSLQAGRSMGGYWPNKDIIQRILVSSSDIETRKKRCEQIIKALFAVLGSLVEKFTDSCFD